MKLSKMEVLQLLASPFGLPFTDDFSASKPQWRGATWSVAGGVSSNTPALNAANQITNGDMELDDATWVFSGTPTTNERSSTQAHAGTYSRHVVVDAAFEGIQGQRTRVTDVWYQHSAWVFGNNTKLILDVKYRTSAYYALTTGGTAGQTIPASWTELICTQWDQNALSASDYRRNISANLSTTADFYIDDIATIPLTLSELFRTLPPTRKCVTAQAVISAIKFGCQAGLVINLDSETNPKYFILGYIDNASAFLMKCINGTFTQLATATITYGAAKVLKLVQANDGVTYQLWYDGVQIGADQTVNDPALNNNTIHGLFSTQPGNSLDSYVLSATPFDASTALPSGAVDRIAWISDVHRDSVYRYGSFDDVVARVNALEGVSSVINTGDTSDDSMAVEFSDYLTYMAALEAGIDQYIIPGNHDEGGLAGEADPIDWTNYDAAFGSTHHFALTAGPFRIIGIPTPKHRPILPSLYYEVPQASKDFLLAELQGLGGLTPIIMAHVPIGDLGAADEAEIAGLCATYGVVAWLNGHDHKICGTSIYGSMTVVEGASTLSTGIISTPLDTTHYGGMMVCDIYSDRMEISTTIARHPFTTFPGSIPVTISA